MKKYKNLFCLLIDVFFSLFFGSCVSFKPVDKIEKISTFFSTTISTKQLEVQNSPVYTPGSIELIPDEVYLTDDLYSFFPTKRSCYYKIDGLFYDYVPANAINQIFDQFKKPDGTVLEPSEMPLMQLVKHYNISRENFDYVVELMKNYALEFGDNVSHEQYELPNADIIYTFDNEIINDYYRRE